MYTVIKISITKGNSTWLSQPTPWLVAVIILTAYLWIMFFSGESADVICNITYDFPLFLFFLHVLFDVHSLITLKGKCLLQPFIIFHQSVHLNLCL